MARTYNERSFSVHPSSMIMVLILIGITALFGSLSIAYIYARIDRSIEGIPVPGLFIFNTFVLASSSFCIHRCKQFFPAKNELQVLRWGFLTIALTLLFLILQGVAWYQWFSTEILPGTSGGHGYLYAISILHFLHVFSGLPFLLRILIPLSVARTQGNAALLFIDDRMARKLRHTAWYWHFIDAVWIYLMLFFVVSTMIG